MSPLEEFWYKETERLKKNLMKFGLCIIEHIDSGNIEEARQFAMDMVVLCEGVGEV